MSFAQPAWIGIGAIICIWIFLLYQKLETDRRRRLESFAAPRLLGRYTATLSTTRRSIKKYLIIMAVFCCFLALARPQYSYKWIDVKRKGIDIMFAIDTSRSMLTNDIKPSRLERAKFGILDFVQKLGGDRVGLLPFAGSSYLLCPLTLDYDAFGQSVNAITTTIIPNGGTNIADTIRDAEKILSESSNHKILLILSDGENLEGDVLKAAKEVAEKNMTIFTIGVGTAGGELIPVMVNGKTSFVKDENGKFVTSKLDEEKLRKIAEITGGTYERLGADGSGLEAIYQQKLAILPKEEIAERKQKVPIERYEWPLGAAIVLLMIEFMLSSRNGSAPDYLNRIKTAGRRLRRTTIPSFLLLIPLLSFQHPLSVEASTGEEAFAKGNYIESSQYYSKRLKKDPDNAKLHYNLGTAQYKNHLYKNAAESFDEALKKSDDPELQKLAYYNLGNSYYEQGKVDIQNTEELWQKSVKAYESCSSLDPTNKKAKENKQIVEKKLEQLKKQKKQQEKNSGQGQQNNQKNGDQSKKGKGGSQSGNTNGSEQQHANKQGDSTRPDDNGKDLNQSAGNPKNDPDHLNNDSDQNPNGTDKSDIPAKDGQDKITAANEDTDSADKGQNAQQAARAEAVKKDGEMSEKEARQLLQSLMAEEDQLNFIPRNNNSKTRRDW